MWMWTNSVECKTVWQSKSFLENSRFVFVTYWSWKKTVARHKTKSCEWKRAWKREIDEGEDKDDWTKEQFFGFVNQKCTRLVGIECMTVCFAKLLIHLLYVKVQNGEHQLVWAPELNLNFHFNNVLRHYYWANAKHPIDKHTHSLTFSHTRPHCNGICLEKQNTGAETSFSFFHNYYTILVAVMSAIIAECVSKQFTFSRVRYYKSWANICDWLHSRAFLLVEYHV